MVPGNDPVRPLYESENRIGEFDRRIKLYP